MPIVSQEQISRFRTKAKAAGFSDSDIEAEVQRKLAEGIAGEGVPLGKIEKDASLREIQAQQLTQGQYVPVLEGAGGTDFALAKQIMSDVGAVAPTYKEEYSGPLDYLKGTFRIKTNAPGSEDEAAFRQGVASIRTAVRNYISGANVSPQESKELTDLIPKATDSDKEIQRKLAGISNWSNRKSASILTSQGYGQQLMPKSMPFVPGFDYEGAKAAGWSDDEIRDYLAGMGK